jgi:phospholipid/cholesterol/gamma-HCH transport system permease protein
MVYQTLYWLGEAGQEELIGTVLVTVLVREVTPILVGLIVLGRSGMVAVAELAALRLGGRVHALEAQGIDPFQLLVLPRAAAFAIACFTLGMMFVLVALITGFVADSLLGTTSATVWAFLDGVLRAMVPRDFAVFPAKMLVIGVLVALTACLTGLGAQPRDDAAELLPHGFVRGVMVILLTSIALSLAI